MEIEIKQKDVPEFEDGIVQTEKVHVDLELKDFDNLKRLLYELSERIGSRRYDESLNDANQDAFKYYTSLINKIRGILNL